MSPFWNNSYIEINVKAGLVPVVRTQGSAKKKKEKKKDNERKNRKNDLYLIKVECLKIT